MLIICNGAIKSGSTWLYNILVSIVPCEHPPSIYLTGRSESSPCIRPDRLEAFLNNEDFVNKSYISKNHYQSNELRTLVSANEDVFLFDIERDPRDVIVSNYYHDKFRNGFVGSFSDYYWQEGRYVAASLSGYHDMWRSSTNPRFFTTSYERLQTAFESEVEAIAKVLGVPLSTNEVRHIKEATSLGNLRSAYKSDPRYQGEKFFRKGEVGDWKNHFNAKTLKDLERVTQDGIPRYEWRNVTRWLSRNLMSRNEHEAKHP